MFARSQDLDIQSQSTKLHGYKIFDFGITADIFRYSRDPGNACKQSLLLGVTPAVEATARGKCKCKCTAAIGFASASGHRNFNDGCMLVPFCICGAAQAAQGV